MEREKRGKRIKTNVNMKEKVVKKLSQNASTNNNCQKVDMHVGIDV